MSRIGNVDSPFPGFDQLWDAALSVKPEPQTIEFQGETRSLHPIAVGSLRKDGTKVVATIEWQFHVVAKEGFLFRVFSNWDEDMWAIREREPFPVDLVRPAIKGG